jgi:hypothetical protein
MTDINEVIERRKMLRGMKDLSSTCHCGKLRVNHTIPEANRCKKETGTMVKRMTKNDIDNMQPRKI